jgi:hypothetical protein
MDIQQLITDKAWVSADGSYGSGGIIVFNGDLLTEAQWDTLNNLGDNDRYDYVLAILNNEDVSEWEG